MVEILNLYLSYFGIIFIFFVFRTSPDESKSCGGSTKKISRRFCRSFLSSSDSSSSSEDESVQVKPSPELKLGTSSFDEFGTRQDVDSPFGDHNPLIIDEERSNTPLESPPESKNALKTLLDSRGNAISNNIVNYDEDDGKDRSNNNNK